METKPIKNRWSFNIDFLEQGDIYFFYKPRKNIITVQSHADVARFYFVLDPFGNTPPRYIVMGNKGMPTFSDGGQTTWGFVQIVGGRGFQVYLQPTQNRRRTGSRPTGEGIYTIVTHGDHTHLLYALELPERLGQVQQAFNITKEANYIFSNRPTAISPNSPEEPYSNFSPIKPEYLNQRGTEVLLVGVGADVKRLGIAADPERETLRTADIFSRLKVDAQRHPLGSLISGKWE